MGGGAFYNEIDPYAADWLRNLIAAGVIAPGVVDERSISEISPDDLRGFTQCHFFAGIGVWSHALRRAGWPDDAPVWTGSCPCQPFSAAGKQAGLADERHLWPVWFDLVRECRPAIVLGEQVASALDWLDLVSADMEGAGYAFGASDLCAAGFDGAHIRQRLYFVGLDWLAHRDDARSQGRAGVPERAGQCTVGAGGVVGGLADAGRERFRGQQPGRVAPAPRNDKNKESEWERVWADLRDGGARNNADAPHLGRTPVDWLFCRDGNWRPVEPGTFPLADAAPARVGRLRAYGNGLDAETATQFIGAVIDLRGGELA